VDARRRLLACASLAPPAEPRDQRVKVDPAPRRERRPRQSAPIMLGQQLLATLRCHDLLPAAVSFGFVIYYFRSDGLDIVTLSNPFYLSYEDVRRSDTKRSTNLIAEGTPSAVSLEPAFHEPCCTHSTVPES